MSDVAVDLREVTVRYEGMPVLCDVTWQIRAGEHWIVIGPNGSGKTTLLQIVGGQRHPSSGQATILGRRLGRTDVCELRKEIGFTGASLGRSLRPQLTALEGVAMDLQPDRGDGGWFTWLA